MNEIRNPLRLNVGFLIHSAIGTYRDFHFEYDRMHLRPDLDVDEFKGVARVSRTPQGLLVQGNFEGNVPAECVRCLKTTPQHLDAEFSELYAFTDKSVTESGLIVPEDGKIDLEPIVREYMVIEIPISPLCKEDCKGLCSFCGVDLNDPEFEHHTHDAEN